MVQSNKLWQKQQHTVNENFNPLEYKRIQIYMSHIYNKTVFIIVFEID